MFRRLIGRCALTVLVLAALALVATFAPVTARDASHPTPALWKVEGPHGQVYFFGSVHVLPKGLVWRSPAVEAALERADQLVFELNLDESGDRTQKSALAVKYGFLKLGESLYALLAPEHRQRLETVAESVGLDPAVVDRMRPWFAAITLNSLSILKPDNNVAPPKGSSASPQGVVGVDAQLWAWAKAAGKARGALETTEDQVRVFADLSRQQEIEYLVVTLDEVKKTSETLGSLIEAWKTGDTAKLDSAFNADLGRYPALRKAILHDRHEKWLPQIERMMADGRTHVIVVGTAHLVGDDSIIAILRAKGVKVEGP